MSGYALHCFGLEPTLEVFELHATHGKMGWAHEKGGKEGGGGGV